MISKCNPREEDGSEKGDDKGRTPEDDDKEYYMLFDDNTLKFAIETLPFYLSRADYGPHLAIHARSLLSYEIGEGKDKLHGKIRLLHEAIDLYLKVSFYLRSYQH